MKVYIRIPDFTDGETVNIEVYYPAEFVDKISLLKDKLSPSFNKEFMKAKIVERGYLPPGKWGMIILPVKGADMKKVKKVVKTIIRDLKKVEEKIRNLLQHHTSRILYLTTDMKEDIIDAMLY